MPTAEEILARTATPETEPHIVIGLDRSVTVPSELREVAVQFDHDIETVIFDCPRYWDGRDLSTMHIFINYTRPDNRLGQFPCTDVEIDESDSNIIHFSWTLSGHVTEVKGSISFLVCAKVCNEDGTLKNRWSSKLNQDMTVLAGMQVSDDTISFRPDTITYILERLDYLETIGSLSDTAAIIERIVTIETGMNKGIDWDLNTPDAPGYIENRPIYMGARSVTWDGDTTNNEDMFISELVPTAEELVGGIIKFVSKGVEYEYPIVGHCTTQSELDSLVATLETTEYAYIASGKLSMVDGWIWVCLPGGDSLAVILPTATSELAAGMYCTKAEETDDSGNITYKHLTELKWYSPTVDPRYAKLFESKPSANEGGDADEPAIKSISVTEAADGTVTMVNTLENGTETIVITADENGNPNKLTYNGKEIPCEWVVS